MLQETIKANHFISDGLLWLSGGERPLKSSPKSMLLLLNLKCLCLSRIFALQITVFFWLFRDDCDFYSTHHALACSPPPLRPSDLHKLPTLDPFLLREADYGGCVKARNGTVGGGGVTSKSRPPSPFISPSAIWGDINVCLANLSDLCW